MPNAEFHSCNQMLQVAMDIGEQMLMTGADVARVEDTVTRICGHFYPGPIEVFCIASLLQASVPLSDGTYCTQMRRIVSNDNNLAKLEALNSISRRLCDGTLSLAEASKAIDDVDTMEPYRPWSYYVAAVVGASAFGFFFGGEPRDVLCAAIVALPVMFLDRHPIKNGNPLVNTIFESFVAGILVNVLVLMGLGRSIDHICIGVIMLMIPGMKFGNAMQDFMKSDVLAGSAKFVHAIILTLMIVMGFAISMYCFGRWRL